MIIPTRIMLYLDIQLNVMLCSPSITFNFDHLLRYSFYIMELRKNS